MRMHASCPIISQQHNQDTKCIHVPTKWIVTHFTKKNPPNTDKILIQSLSN